MHRCFHHAYLHQNTHWRSFFYYVLCLFSFVIINHSGAEFSEGGILAGCKDSAAISDWREGDVRPLRIYRSVALISRRLWDGSISGLRVLIADTKAWLFCVFGAGASASSMIFSVAAFENGCGRRFSL